MHLQEKEIVPKYMDKEVPLLGTDVDRYFRWAGNYSICDQLLFLTQLSPVQLQHLFAGNNKAFGLW